MAWHQAGAIVADRVDGADHPPLEGRRNVRKNQETVVAVVYRFEGWEFELASGELRPDEGDPVRVQPQPAELLELLLRRAGEVVTREDIIDSVWSDTKVEFDQAVNYGIRHLRSALGESAVDSRYIETLPRRGYRFMLPVTRHDDDAVPVGTPEERPGRRWILTAAFAVAILGVWGSSIRSGGGVPLGPSDPVGDVVAVMVLRHEAEDSAAAGAAVRAGERLTANLTVSAGGRARVVGPRTTEDYRTQRDMLSRLRDEFEVSYLVSGSIAPDIDDGLFLELIRISDRAHLWAMTAAPSAEALDAASDSVAARLGWR